VHGPWLLPMPGRLLWNAQPVVEVVVVVVVVEGELLEVVDDGGVDVEVVVVPVVEVDAEVVLVVEVEPGTVEEVVEGGTVDVVVVLDEGGITTCALVVDVVLDFGGRFVVPEPDVSAKTSTAIATAATAIASTVLTGNLLRCSAAAIGSVGSPSAPKPSAATGVDMTDVRSIADWLATWSEASDPVAPASSAGCCSVVSKSGDPPGWVGKPPVAFPCPLAEAAGSPPKAAGSPAAALSPLAAAPVSTSSVCGAVGVAAPLGAGVSFGSSRSAKVPGSP
jgi:hypothetical protein